MVYTLHLLHITDQEGAAPALEDAPNASAVLNALDAQYDNTLRLSAGDLWLPGLFYTASEEVYGAPGIGDVLINNALGLEAAAFGNHEFDQGTAAIRTLLEANLEIVGPGIGEGGYTGTLFPYLSSNLDFSNDPNLADLVVADGQEASTLANGIAKSTIVTVGDEQIGVVGATTPTLRRISSPGPDVGINPADPADFDALAAIIQASVDDLIDANPGLNKVILMAHTQVLGIEVNELAPRLRHVDIIIGGGSDSILANPENRLRDGDEAVDVYPIIQRDADNNPVAIVATDGQYLYIGQLLVTFDANGIIDVNSIDPTISGAYATDAAGVAALGAEDLVDPVVAEVIAALTGVVEEKERNLFGITEVFLNARRDGGGLDGVRNQETNLGNLTADANLWYGQQIDPTVQISIKNGGGIRESIGAVTTLAGETEPTRIAPEAAELFGKPAGGITQTDVESVLAFNNGLTLVSITAAELLEILEHTVSTANPDNQDVQIGSFAHVGGIAYSFDPTLPARETDLDGNQTAAGQRIRSVALLDDEGTVAEVIVENGEVQGDPDRTFRTVLLDFLANGGSGYPIPQRDRIDLTEEGMVTVDQITVGDFEIGFDASRVSDTTSGLFVADTISGLGTLFDISTLSLEQLDAGEGTLSVGPADLLLSSELATVLNLPELAGADVGDARIDALIAPTDTESLFSVVGGTTSVFLDRNAFRFGAMLNLVGADSTGTPFSDDFQVGLPITEATGATVLLGADGSIAGFAGILEHSGSVTFNQEYASFAAPGGEQDAFAEYLAAFFSPLAESGFNQEDTPRELDSRIQNLTFRSDTLIDPVGPVDPTPVVPSLLVPLGTYETGIFDESAAEIVVHDPVTQRLFVVNASAPSVDVLDISDPNNLSLVRSIDTSGFGAEVNSVAVANGIVAVAVEAEEKTDPGSVVFFDIDGNFLKAVTVGAQPDMLTFTPDGSKVLVANEGEPNDDYTIDPEGSISIIDLSGGVANLTQANVTTADFAAFNDQRDALIASGVRIFGPNASVAQDVEPEYIAVTGDSRTAYVALQENNALAVVDIESGTITDILPLGFKDHSVFPLDASDRDDAINITTYPNLFGMYMPDAISLYEVGGETFIVTANEGDARDYDGFSEEARVKDLVLDPDAFLDAYELQKDENLGRLTVTRVNGLSDGVFFKADLTGDQEVGPVETSAEGSAVLKLNEDRTALSYTITVEGLDFGPILGLASQTPDTDDDVTLLHFHEAPAGANGPVVFGIFGPNQDPDVIATINDDGSTTITGTWSETDPANQPLSAFIPALLEAEIGEEVGLYLNLHTVGNPGGEIRGQLGSTLAYDELYAYGARSFSIWDAEGNLVFDSGDDFEQRIAALFPDEFNSTNDENGTFDNRSDNKGPEPEGVAIGEIDGRTYAFIGLERFGGVVTYDITNPAESFFVDLVNNRDFGGDPEAGTAGDLGAEGVIFISEADSPNGKPLVVVGNEVSGTTTVFDASALQSAPDIFLDLRNLTGDVTTSFTVNREAAFDNFVGFYQVTDINGGVDIDGDGIADFTPGQAGYTEAALAARAETVALTTANRTESVFESSVAGGSLYAPFLIANGNLDSFNSWAVYFAFGAANADGVEHIRFNNGALEFEDLFGGGDNDFNDMVVEFAVAA